MESSKEVRSFPLLLPLLVIIIMITTIMTCILLSPVISSWFWYIFSFIACKTFQFSVLFELAFTTTGSFLVSEVSTIESRRGETLTDGWTYWLGAWVTVSPSSLESAKMIMPTGSRASGRQGHVVSTTTSSLEDAKTTQKTATEVTPCRHGGRCIWEHLRISLIQLDRLR